MFVIKVLQWFIDWYSQYFPDGVLISEFDIPNLLSTVRDFIAFISWVLPLDTILSIFAISILLILIRIVVALWKLLPLT